MVHSHAESAGLSAASCLGDALTRQWIPCRIFSTLFFFLLSSSLWLYPTHWSIVRGTFPSVKDQICIHHTRLDKNHQCIRYITFVYLFPVLAAIVLQYACLLPLRALATRCALSPHPQPLSRCVSIHLYISPVNAMSCGAALRSMAVARAMEELNKAGKSAGEGGRADSTSAGDDEGMKLLEDLEGRRIRVTGEFDHSKEVLVGEQTPQGISHVSLLALASSCLCLFVGVHVTIFRILQVPSARNYGDRRVSLGVFCSSSMGTRREMEACFHEGPLKNDDRRVDERLHEANFCLGLGKELR